MMAKKIKFGLEMKDGEVVRGIEALREHFDLTKAVEHFSSGKLSEWLEDRYFDDEAAKINAIDRNAPIDVIQRQLCEALGVDVPKNVGEVLDLEIVRRNNEKKDLLRQKTSDQSIIDHAAQTAFHRDDLSDLWDAEEPVIYLCGDSFKINSRLTNHTYIGVLGTPKIEIDVKSREELAAKGIKFENVELPEHLREIPARICPKCGEKVRDKAKFCDACGASMDEKTVAEEKHTETATATKKWKALPKEKLQALYKANFKTTFMSDEENRLTPKDVWGIAPPPNVVLGKASKANLDADEKEGLLMTIGQGQYTENDLIHIRVKSDLSGGWALTTDSVCFAGNWGSEIIPYAEIIEIRDRFDEIELESKWDFKCHDGKEITIDLEDVGGGGNDLKRYLLAAKKMCK